MKLQRDKSARLCKFYPLQTFESSKQNNLNFSQAKCNLNIIIIYSLLSRILCSLWVTYIETNTEKYYIVDVIYVCAAVDVLGTLACVLRLRMFVALCHEIVNNMAYFHTKVSAFVAVNTRISFNAGEIFVIIYQPFKNNIILFSLF